MKSKAKARPGRPAAAGNGLVGRPWLGVNFECCGVYARIYRSADGVAYSGRCPRCLRPISMRVGQGGVSQRLFRAR